MREAISLFDQAIALDPQFALAMAISSNACFNLQLWHPGPDQADLMAKCLSLAQRAVQIDRNDYRVLAWASYSYLICNQPITAVELLIERALELNPGDSVTHWLSGWINVFAPNPLKALSAFEIGLRLDPQSLWRASCHAGQATALMQLDRFEDAIPFARFAADQHAAVRATCNTIQAAAYGFLGRAGEARALDSVSYPLQPNDEAFFDNVRDGSLKPKILEGLRLAGIAPEQV